MQITNEEARLNKERCLADIASNLDRYEKRLKSIDIRLWQYAQDLIRTDIDVHNEIELLGFRKFLRILDTYPFNVDKVHHVFRTFEHLTFDGLKGRQHYPLTPVQCFMLAGVFGPMKSEEQYTRIVTDAVFYIVRKFCKTTMAAFFAFYFMLYEDYNAEIYCCANSAAQANILYKMAKGLVAQVDPAAKRIRQTATICEWRGNQPRSAKIEALTATSKAKDGLFAQLCCADEYGSAAYINEKSDMGQLVSVVEGSTGARVEPLTLTTTTAGRITAGPFKDKLVGMEATLRRELDIPLDGRPHQTDQDWQFALLFQPDLWERTEESLRQPNVWRKVNPHLSITVQESYYENEWKKMDLDNEKKAENLCKLFNVYQSGKTIDWIKPEAVKALQQDMTIEDLDADSGWQVFTGLDFSMGDDFTAATYLAWKVNERGQEEFFADLDAWISRAAFNKSPYKMLFKTWEEHGWLHIVEGEVVEPSVVVNRIIHLYEEVGINMIAFGFDPYKAKSPINALRAWCYSLGFDDKQVIIPVRQNFATYNPLVDEMSLMVLGTAPMIRFSPSPLWPWEFGNCLLAESNDGMENRKPVKGGDAAGKVDNIQCLLSALYLFDLFDSKETSTID